MKRGHKPGTRDLLADNVLDAIRNDDAPSGDPCHVAEVILAGIDKTLGEMRRQSKYRPWLERLRARVVTVKEELGGRHAD